MSTDHASTVAGPPGAGHAVASRSLPSDPGKARGLQRITTSDGFLLACAVDHVTEFRELLGPSPDFARTVRAKVDLVRDVAPVTSAVLVDALYGVGYLGPTGALPRDVGLMVSLEDGDYSLSSPKATRYRAGWGPRQAREAGVDAVKLLWWYRPDGDPALAESQRRTLRALAHTCTGLGLLLVVEPIWFPRPGEDTSSPGWRAARAGGIAESAATAEALGADVLKVEFPADLEEPDGEAMARDALSRLDATVSRPWVLLSAGVPFGTFERQLELACAAGASGYIAGRSLWREAASARAEEREEAVATMVERLASLNRLTRRCGRPAAGVLSVESAVAALPEAWYENGSPSQRWMSAAKSRP
jgi:tagatose 1,6-diphosphate aldolase